MRSTDWVEADARAKVNLYLRVFPRAPDGFHPLETIFCRISFSDVVRARLREDPGVSIEVHGTEHAPASSANLAVRAAELFLKETALDCGVDLELEKNIPAGSGLGGGSSDAATVLRLLNGLSDLNLEVGDLMRLAGQLGSDVPFFVIDAPLAAAWGRGERLLEAPPLSPRPFLLLLPDEPISTADAYAWLDEAGETSAEAAKEPPLSWESISDWESVRALAHNDFQSTVFARHETLRTLHDELQRTAPLIGLLSGSGSALFAVYDDEEKMRTALGALEQRLESARLLSASGPV